MKLSGYILSLYVVLIAVIPCCSFDDCPDDKIITAQTGEHESGDKDCGTCSPFFNCESCASVTTDINMFSLTVPAVGLTQSYTDFVSFYIPELHYDFWQPPKIG